MGSGLIRMGGRFLQLGESVVLRVSQCVFNLTDWSGIIEDAIVLTH